MAEAQTIVVLTAGERIHSPEPVDEINSRLKLAPAGRNSFIHVSDTQGRDHWVSVKDIVQIYASD